MTRKQRRFALIASSLVVLGAAVGLVLFALNDSIVFFHSPTELVEKNIRPGTRLRIGFRPYAVQVSNDLGLLPYRAVLRHTFFLGILLRLELELPSGLILRSRMTKEEYAQLGLEDGREVSFQIKNYRVLASENAQLSPELESRYQAPPTLGENI